MLRSIQFSLQLWHALLLAAVLAAFGITGYSVVSRMRYQEIDADLERTAHLLAASVRPPHGGGPGGGGGPPPHDGEWGDHSDEDRPHGGHHEFHSPPPEPPHESPREGPGPQHSEHRPSDRTDRGSFPDPDVQVPATIRQRAGESGSGAIYYVVWHFDDVLKQAGAAGNVLHPDPGNRRPPEGPAEPVRIRQRGELREAYVFGTFDTCALVGRSIGKEHAELARLGWLFGGIGSGVLLVGLLGGWLLSRRTLRPIAAMAAAAQDISASNLSRRIDATQAKAELGMLATVLNQTFDRLEAAFRQQVRFTADASHELRTPLSVIHTHAQLALSRDRSSEEYRKAIETCLRASSRMKGLVDSLLLLARADAGRLSLECRDVDLQEIVQECVEITGPLASDKRVTVRATAQPTRIHADETRVAQVVTNLLTNAIRYNAEGGRVDVAIKSNGTSAILTVTDTGVGIPTENQAHVFERFYRVDESRNRQDGGSGLGLAICKSIVEAHGGTISFRSQTGQGTTFSVTFPLADDKQNLSDSK